MRIGVRDTVELLTRKEAHLYAAGTTIVNQALDALIVPFTRDTDIFETACARLQRLAYRMDTVENDHGHQVYDRKN
jgi:hypothetical protein